MADPTPPPQSPSTVPTARKATLATMLTSPRAVWRFLRDPKAPVASKLLTFLTVVYVVSPIDAIPDWLVPVLGWCDDVGVTAAALAYVASQAARYVNENSNITATPVAQAPAEKPSSS